MIINECHKKIHGDIKVCLDQWQNVGSVLASVVTSWVVRTNGVLTPDVITDLVTTTQLSG